MKKEPFVINIADRSLPNLAQDSPDSFGLQFNQTNLWQDDNLDMLKLLNSVNEKMDMIIRILQKTTKEQP